jgi:hypothetical protein
VQGKRIDSAPSQRMPQQGDPGVSLGTMIMCYKERADMYIESSSFRVVFRTLLYPSSISLSL